ncbi:MAG TPA: hypothetical protein PKE29_14490 [Phycisphaerales bacterium]|nr:hypothetical protein [Phycisphaerales bacterium]
MKCVNVFRGAGVLVCAGAMGLGGCSGYHPGVYAGDGTMTGSPKAAPRYDVDLGPISLAAPSRSEYRLERLPGDNLLALIVLDEPTAAKQAWVDSSGTRVKMTLTDGDTGRESVKSGPLVGGWSQTAESWDGERAEFEGIWFRPSRHSWYTLVVEVMVDRPQPNAPTMIATVHVRGGGFGTY